MRRIDYLMEEVINGDIQTPEQMKKTLNEDYTSNESIVEVFNECKNEIIKDVFLIKSKTLIAEYVQKEQIKYLEYTKRLLAIRDFRGSLFQEKERTKTMNSLLRDLYFCTDKIVSFIESRYNMYVDKNLPASYHNKLMLLPEIKMKIEVILKHSEGQEISKTLWDIVKFILTKANGIAFNDNVSINRIDFLSKLLGTWENLAIENKFNENEIMESLFFMNFNHHMFLNYLSSRIENDIQEYDNIMDCIDKLNFYRHQFNIKHVREDICYTGKNKSIKMQIALWLKRLISYKVSLRKDKIYEQINHDLEDCDEKIDTELSVSQIAYLLNLLFQTEIFNNENKSKTIRIICQTVSSKTKDNISPGSIQRKMYEIDSYTISTIRELLIKMLNLVKI